MNRCSNCSFQYMAIEPNCPNCGLERTDSYPVDAFKKLMEIENHHFWFSSRNALIADMIKLFFSKANNFMEIGCGTGNVLSFLSQHFSDLKLYGSDLYAEGLKYAKERLPKVELFQMDAKNIFFKDAFDVIGAFDILEHIEDDHLVLSEINKALTTKGGLIVTVPQHRNLWSKTDEYALHVRRYSSKELREKLKAAGFYLERMTSFVTLLLPAMYLSRLRYKFNLTKNTEPVEFNLPNGLNNIFKVIQNFERKIINQGINFPLGGSLLAVARKIT